MTFIQVHQRGDGTEIPDGYNFLIVVAEEIDAQGNWVPSSVQPFRGVRALWNALKVYLESGDKVVIRASASICGIPEKFGLKLLFAEWGSL